MTSSNQAPQHPAELTGETEAAARAGTVKLWFTWPTSGAQYSWAIWLFAFLSATALGGQFIWPPDKWS